MQTVATAPRETSPAQRIQLQIATKEPAEQSTHAPSCMLHAGTHVCVPDYCSGNPFFPVPGIFTAYPRCGTFARFCSRIDEGGPTLSDIEPDWKGKASGGARFLIMSRRPVRPVTPLQYEICIEDSRFHGLGHGGSGCIVNS